MQKAGGSCEPPADECSFPGNDLLSRKLALEVPLVLKGLTAGFEMGPGVTPSLKSPRKRAQGRNVFNYVDRTPDDAGCRIQDSENTDRAS